MSTQDQQQVEDPEFASEELEAALPSLTEKLKALQGDLSEDEQAVFSSIVNSAALHLESLQTLGTTAEVQYFKPISAVATTRVREHLLDLPHELGVAGNFEHAPEPDASPSDR
jgi:hypothetical protein